MIFLKFFWNAVGCFAYDFNQMSQGKVECKVFIKVISIPALRNDNSFLGIVKHVLEWNRRITP